MKKRYNVADRKAANKARHEAVIYLLARGYSFKAAGYAVGRTGEFARSRQAKEIRRLSRPNITSKHTA